MTKKKNPVWKERMGKPSKNKKEKCESGCSSSKTGNCFPLQQHQFCASSLVCKVKQHEEKSGRNCFFFGSRLLSLLCDPELFPQGLFEAALAIRLFANVERNIPILDHMSDLALHG